MLIQNSYIYEINEIEIKREGKELLEYFQLRIKHRDVKKTTVVFTHCIKRRMPNAFNDLLQLAERMKRLHY